MFPVLSYKFMFLSISIDIDMVLDNEHEIGYSDSDKDDECCQNNMKDYAQKDKFTSQGVASDSFNAK